MANAPKGASTAGNLPSVYGNAKEAAHVIVAVPFALTGGVFLQYLLGYNFSVARFGAAIQARAVGLENGRARSVSRSQHILTESGVLLYCSRQRPDRETNADWTGGLGRQILLVGGGEF